MRNLTLVFLRDELSHFCKEQRANKLPSNSCKEQQGDKLP